MQPLKIEPDHVHIDTEGLRTRRWFVRLPEGMVADDVKDPAIWSKVQANRQKTLAPHDAVYLVGYAEKFAVEARVTHATASAVVLALQKIISFSERLTPLFSDGCYRVVWATDGFAVERIADQSQIGGTFGSEALAVRFLQQQYSVHR